MTYSKPEVVALETAVNAVQTPTSKPAAVGDSDVPGAGVSPGYEADE
jgi:hypothetical protein